MENLILLNSNTTTNGPQGAVETISTAPFFNQEVGIVYTFLRVFPAVQNVIGDGIAIPLILICGFRYGKFGALPIKINDFVIVHGCLLSCVVKAFHLYTQQKWPIIA